jgi:hypothetical protein
MSRTLYYTVRVTAENELGDRRTYDAVDFWNSMTTDTLDDAQFAVDGLASALHEDGYTIVTRRAIRAVTTTTEGR